MKAPCYNCTQRTLGCHSTCTKYQEWKAKQQQSTEEIWKYKGQSIGERLSHVRKNELRR